MPEAEGHDFTVPSPCSNSRLVSCPLATAVDQKLEDLQTAPVGCILQQGVGPHFFVTLQYELKAGQVA